MRKSSRGNPWHDERGRFCSGPKAVSKSEVNYETRQEALRNGAYDRKDARDLRQLTKRAIESPNGGKLNAWEIRRGGYDKWYEAYYNGEPAFEVVDGEVEVYQDKYNAYAQDFSVVSGYKRKTPSYASIARNKKGLATDEYPDGTYDAETLKEIDYDSGYQVTYCQIGDTYSDEEHEELIREFIEKTDDQKVALGKFEGEPEHSFHFTSKEDAIAYAKKYNQISIWDWENGDTIETGGTGRRK